MALKDQNPNSLPPIQQGMWAAVWIPILRGMLLGIQQSGGSGAGLPDQGGHSGEYLTTDGTTASWNTVTAPSLEEVVAVGATSTKPIINPGDNLVTVKKTIDALSTGTTLITALESTMGRFFVLQIRYVLKSLTGAVSTPAIVNVGYTSGSNYNDFVNAQNFTSSSANVANNVTLVNTGLSAAGGTSVYIDITTAMTGPTVYEFDLHILGYYEGA